MILFRELDRGIRQRASPLVATGDVVGHVLKPSTKLRAWVARMLCRQLVPGRARLIRQTTQVLSNQLVL
jgi:hypothetical protein